MLLELYKGDHFHSRSPHVTSGMAHWLNKMAESWLAISPHLWPRKRRYVFARESASIGARRDAQGHQDNCSVPRYPLGDRTIAKAASKPDGDDAPEMLA